MNVVSVVISGMQTWRPSSMALTSKGRTPTGWSPFSSTRFPHHWLVGRGAPSGQSPHSSVGCSGCSVSSNGGAVSDSGGAPKPMTVDSGFMIIQHFHNFLSIKCCFIVFR